MSSESDIIEINPIDKTSYFPMEPGLALEQLTSGTLLPPDLIDHAKDVLSNGGTPYWHVPLAMALYLQHNYAGALENIKLAESSITNEPNLYIIGGMCARQIPGCQQLARDFYHKAISLAPTRADVFYNLGNLLKDDQPEEAESYYITSLKLNPSSATVWHNLGICLNNQNRHDEALFPLKLSLRLDPSVPDAWCNLGLAYYGSDKFEPAERGFRYTISLDRHHAASHLNLGNALLNNLQPEEAITYLERGVELEHSSTNSLFNLGLAYLLLGRYPEGWEYYEARFSSKDFNAGQIPTSGPRIRRFDELSASDSETLVVWSEQGMGDSIQFSRYLYLLLEINVPFVFLTRPCLLRLHREWMNFPFRVDVLGSTDPSTDKRPHLPLMSLPLVFQTRLSTVPSSTPYLHTEQATPHHLLVDPPAGGISLAFVWASNPDNKAMYRHKSMPADLLFAPLLKLCDLGLISLHSLQFGRDADQLAPMRYHPRVTEWHDRLSDYSDTAFLLRQMDLIISVDTAVAHLAGALGRPTWLLLPLNADFRWLRDRSDSPWYPTMRLFRQSAHGDWSSVANQVKAALDVMFLLDLKGLSSSALHP